MLLLWPRHVDYAREQLNLDEAEILELVLVHLLMAPMAPGAAKHIRKLRLFYSAIFRRFST